MFWRAILIGINLAGLLFLVFAIWTALDEYERGNVSP